MPMSIPAPIAAYFAADRSNKSSIAECFTENATVRDEGKTYAGRSAIQDWKTNASRKYSYSIEPFAIESAGNDVVVSATVTGNFPGSPVDLRYLFALDGDKIASLEVKL